MIKIKNIYKPIYLILIMPQYTVLYSIYPYAVSHTYQMNSDVRMRYHRFIKNQEGSMPI